MPQLPEAFLHQMADQLGENFPLFLSAMEMPAQRGLRLNQLKPHEISNVLSVEENIPWAPSGRYIAGESLAGQHILHKAGAWYIQEPSAMIAVSALDPKPGEWILDLCAAPGGKSSQIGEALQGKGLLMSNEVVYQRAEQLSRTIEATGIVNALVTSAQPEKLAQQWSELFDGVLVDAPCSGSGMFRKYPELIPTWTAETPAGCARRQKKILDAAAQLVRPGGRLVYSTCSFDRRENEAQILHFLRCHPSFQLEPFALPAVDSSQGMLTVYPHQIKGEGHFVAQLRHKGDAPAADFREACIMPLPLLPGEVQQAWRQIAPGSEWTPNILQGGDLAWSPPVPDCRGIALLRRGLKLATRRGKTWLPHHAWAMSERTDLMPIIPLDGESACRYMAGEALPDPGDHQGFACVAYGGCHLGWVKAAQGVLKNHLPKGLRISKGLVWKA